MKRLLARYLEIYPSERARLRPFGEFLAGHTTPRQLFGRANFAGHITASGFVLSPDHTKLVLVKHKTLHRHLQPGGHVEESDPTVLAAAQREIAEETGLQSCHYLPFHKDRLMPIDIDSHEIPANPKKGEPRHVHHDFRYLFRARKESDPRGAGETEWVWRPWQDAIQEPTFALVLGKLRRFSTPAA